jgi:hypothetical protein
MKMTAQIPNKVGSLRCCWEQLVFASLVVGEAEAVNKNETPAGKV